MRYALDDKRTMSRAANRATARSWRTVSVATGLSWLMKLLLLGLVPYEFYKGEYLFTFATVMAFFISLIPSIVERNYRITLPFELDLLFTISVFLHTFMGEGMDFYQRVRLWDKFLHFYGGLVMGLLAFLIVYTFHYTRKLRLTIPLVGLLTATFAMAVGGMWEVGEFTVDSVFGTNAQNGLADTMWDMINDLTGGVAAAALGMVYVRYSKPETRKRLARPLGEVFGMGRRIDRVRRRLKHDAGSLPGE
jgi:VanZ family protein